EFGERPRALELRAAGRAHVVGPAEVRRSTVAGVRVPREVRADRVVLLALVGIGEDLVGLVDLLEALLGLGLLVHVRVVLPGELPVRLLDVLGRGVLRHAEGLVIVLVLDRHGRLPLVRRRWRRRRARRLYLRPGHG